MLNHCALGRALLRAFDYDGGIARLRECVEDGEAIIARVSTNYVLGELGFARLNLGRALLTSPRPSPAEGCAMLRAGLELSEQVAAAAPALAVSANTRREHSALLERCR
jgi:hypothetical protein